jgi:uncharacterized protein
MRIDLSQLGPEGRTVEETYGPGELEGGGRSRDGGLWEPLRIDLRAEIRSEGRFVRATGGITAEVRTECDRCLKSMTVGVSETFDQRFGMSGPEPVRGRDGDVELSESDLDAVAVEGGILDTRELAREQLALAFPIRTICSEACAGLCPICGADRNAGPCDCTESATDPRWDALKKILNEG